MADDSCLRLLVPVIKLEKIKIQTKEEIDIDENFETELTPLTSSSIKTETGACEPQIEDKACIQQLVPFIKTEDVKPQELFTDCEKNKALEANGKCDNTLEMHSSCSLQNEKEDFASSMQQPHNEHNKIEDLIKCTFSGKAAMQNNGLVTSMSMHMGEQFIFAVCRKSQKNS